MTAAVLKINLIIILHDNQSCISTFDKMCIQFRKYIVIYGLKLVQIMRGRLKGGKLLSYCIDTFCEIFEKRLFLISKFNRQTIMLCWRNKTKIKIYGFLIKTPELIQ